MSESLLSLPWSASIARHQKREETAAWRLLAPAITLIALLLVLPTLAVLFLSLTDMELGSAHFSFVGADNYRRLLADAAFLKSLGNTAFYVALVTPASVALGLGAALLIESATELRGFFRSAYFLPVVSLTVAMATVWQYLMHPVVGPINLLLAMFGLPMVNFLGSSDTVLYALALIGIWQATGFAMVLFLAGLTAIDRQLYQAAAVDGAKGAWERFRLVTWPMLGPTTLFVTTITMINAVKVFETVKALTEGGPAKASEVLLLTIYNEGFVFLSIGPASAMAVVFIVIMMALVWLQTRLAERQVHYS